MLIGHPFCYVTRGKNKKRTKKKKLEEGRKTANPRTTCLRP